MDIHSLILTWRNHYKRLPQRQKRYVRIFSLVLGIVLLIILIKSCQGIKKQTTNNAPLLIREQDNILIPEGSPLRSQIQVLPVIISNAPHIVDLPGIVEGNQVGNLNILPSTTGHLVSLNVSLGEEVKKDQVLAVIESAGFAQAYADKIKAQSAFTQAKDALTRAQKVNRAGANSVKDLELLQNNYTQAQAELQRTQTALQSLGTYQENQLQIRAPMNGKVTTLNYGLGSFINDPTLPLLTLSNINAVWVTICVPENLIALIAPNQKVDISLAAYPEQVRQGQITFVNQLIDSESRCNKSRIALDNLDAKLQPNMFASVKTQLPQPGQVMIPLSAILMNNDKTSVFVETKPWSFKRRTVVLGTEDGNLIRITSGLRAGDRIVTAGGILVND
mgnify:CR=1 FL=1